MSVIRIAIAAGICLLRPLGAQPSATVRVAEPVRAAVGYWGMFTRVDSIPIGTPITGPRFVEVFDGGARGRCDVAPRGQLGLQVDCSVGASLLEVAQTDGALEWTLAGPVNGWLTLEVTPTSWRGTSRASITGPGVDFTVWNGNLGGPTFRRQQHISAPGPLTLRCSFVASAAGSLVAPGVAAWLQVRIEFSSGLSPIQRVAYGNPCGMSIGAVDVPTPLVHELAFDVGNAFPLSPVLLLFGGRRASIPIGSSPCLLLTEPIAVVALGSNVSGNAGWRLELPGPLRSPPFDLQAVSLDVSWQVRASPGLELQFVD